MFAREYRYYRQFIFEQVRFGDVLGLNFPLGIDQCPSRVDLDSIAPFTLLLAFEEHSLML